MNNKNKELYTTPEIKVEELSKTDVICESAPRRNYNIESTYQQFFTWIAEPNL